MIVAGISISNGVIIMIIIVPFSGITDIIISIIVKE